MSGRKYFDLILASALALLTLGISMAGIRSASEFETLPRWFIPGGVLMTLFVPGYSLLSGLLPSISGPVKWMMSLVLSICLSIVGGLLLNYLDGGLNVTTWSAWLGALTLLGCGIAAWRRISHPEAASSTLKWLPDLKGVFLLLLAFSIGLLAIQVNRLSAEQAASTFTQLWALPVSSGNSPALKIGVQNHEHISENYHVYVESGGKYVADWRNIQIEPEGSWTTTLTLDKKPVHPLNVFVFRSESPTKIYRTVNIAPGAFTQDAPPLQAP